MSGVSGLMLHKFLIIMCKEQQNISKHWTKFTFTHVHSILGAHLLLCGETRQLVQQYVVFCCDCGQPGGGGQVKKVHQTAGVVVLLFLLLLLLWGSGEGLGVDTSRRAGLPHSQNTCKRGKRWATEDTDTQISRSRAEPLLPAVMKCKSLLFTPISEKSLFLGKSTTPSTAWRQRQHTQKSSCGIVPPHVI